MFPAKITSFTRTLATKLTAHQEALKARGLPKRGPIPGVEHVIVVASGKGGVGKSTIAVNLAVALAAKYKRVGLLDADIFGPSVPLMMNIKEQPIVNDDNFMIPPVNYGVKCLSMGMLASSGDAIIWRGPLVMSALQRLLKSAVWGPLDILIVDTPPGTGDVHLSLTQNVPLSGVLLVSTPQIAALEVTERGAKMYKTFNVPLLGLVENMGYAICSKCQGEFKIFNNSTDKYTKQMGTIVIEKIPLATAITESCDSGIPLVISQPDSHYAKCFDSLSSLILQLLERKSEQRVK